MQQKLALDQFYRELKGETPTKETISDLATQLNLSEQQVYKWFWDTNKKIDSKPLSTGSENSQSFERIQLVISKAQSHKDEFEELANELGIDVEKLVDEILEGESPSNTRQTVRRLRKIFQP